MYLEVEFIDNDMQLDVDFGEVQEIIVAPDRYTGPYEIIPAAQEQILHTAEKTMDQDVIVKAIPKEYGLVTYNQDKTLKIT